MYVCSNLYIHEARGKGPAWLSQPQLSLAFFHICTGFLSSQIFRFLCTASHQQMLASSFTMASTPADYDGLPSENASISPTLCQPENQLICEGAESSTAILTSDTPSRTSPSRALTIWKWEVAACLVIFAIPLIILGTLYPHSGHPLPQWPFKVSINSLLSVYALVLKATIGFILTSCTGQLQWTWFSETRPLTDMLYFDSATRGADGALSLILRQRFRHPLTALGCIITILAVAIDPFVQQLVRPVNCTVELLDDNDAASLPRTNIFEDGYRGNSSTTGAQNDEEKSEKVIESVLYDAIFNPGQDPPWQCSTGNCTFEDTYGTIGVCYSCQDVSADVIITKTCSPPNSSYASQHPTFGSDCPANSSFTVESNITIGEYMNLGTKVNVSSLGYPDTFVVANTDAVDGVGPYYGTAGRELIFGFLIGATTNPDGRIDYTTSDSVINGTTDDNPTCVSDDTKESWACQGYGAATCSLKPCVHIYNATISAGVLEEHLVASSSSAAWGTVSTPDGFVLCFALVDTHCSNGIETQPGRNSNASSRWLPYEFRFTEADTERNDFGSPIGYHLPDEVTSLLDKDCLYLISASDTMYSVEEYLSGTIRADSAVIIPGTPRIAGSSIIGGVSAFEGPQIVQNIYNWGHTDFERVQSVFANISASLTTYIRTHGGSLQLLGSERFQRDVQGKVYHYATCLQVQWPWLAYPASLAVLTILFFWMVVEVTRSQGTSVWKASPLAWVLRVEGLGKNIFPSSQGSCKTMKDRSTQIAVRLLEGDLDGPRIRIADLKDPDLL